MVCLHEAGDPTLDEHAGGLKKRPFIGTQYTNLSYKSFRLAGNDPKFLHKCHLESGNQST